MTPEDWRDVKLGELAAKAPDSFVDGDWIESKDQDENGTVRLLQVGNVQRGSLKTTGSKRWVTDETVRRLNCTLLLPGDILIARMPDPIGRACLMPELPYRAITAVDCAILRVDRQCVDPCYAVQYFNAEQHLSAVASHITGTTRQRISRSNLAELGVLLPPLPEQRKIAAILSSVDDAIESTQAVIDQLGVVKKAMMSELLTRGLPGRHTKFKQTEIGEVPEGWEVLRLGEVCRIGNGSTPSRLREDYWIDGSIPWLPTGKVNERNIVAADEFVTAKALDECSIRLLNPGTLLIAMIGQGKTRGMVAYLSIAATINQNFAYVTPSDSLRSWFLFSYLDHHYDDLRGSGRGSNQGALNCSIIKAFPVPIPPPDEQEEIERALLFIERRLDDEQLFSQALVKTKSALASVLLTGELRVTPDEPPP